MLKRPIGLLMGVTRKKCRTVDAQEVATLMISMLEGALAMSRLYRDETRMNRAVKHLTEYVADRARA
jgi:TetR/AcrR family transcriptional repressor of nem operon